MLFNASFCDRVQDALATNLFQMDTILHIRVRIRGPWLASFLSFFMKGEDWKEWRERRWRALDPRMSVMFYIQHDSNRTDTGQTRRLTNVMRAGVRKFGFGEQSLVYKFASSSSHFPRPRLSPVSNSNSQVIHYGQHSCRMIRNSRSSTRLSTIRAEFVLRLSSAHPVSSSRSSTCLVLPSSAFWITF